MATFKHRYNKLPRGTITVTVDIDAKPTRRLRLRMWVAMRLVAVAAWLLGQNLSVVDRSDWDGT